MKDSGMVGIGCFAKPETLFRVLKKMVEGYILGNFEGFATENNGKPVSSELIDFLRCLIGGVSENQRPVRPSIIENLESKKITGFFLALKSEGLNLSVFTREDKLKCKKITANLDALTQIRKKRLN